MKSLIKKIGLSIGFGLLSLAVVLLVRTIEAPTEQAVVSEVAPEIAVDRDEVAKHLARVLQFKTISYSDPSRFDTDEFLRLHAYLKQTFPQVHAVLTRDVVADYSLLYTWKGTNDKLKPVMLMGHLDVVPVESESSWTYGPFDGQIADGYIWGRGAMDDKLAVMGILEAVELLLSKGYQPQRTIYLGFGHDEEVGGHNGPAEIAALLEARGVEIEYVLDEGGEITEGVSSEISRPIAFVTIADKGYMDLELRVETEGGHSATPPQNTAIGILSAAIYRLEQNPLPPRLSEPVQKMFERISPEMPFVMRIGVENQWLLGGIVLNELTNEPTTNALVRSTTAVTMIEGGVTANALPSHASAIVNARILPGDSSDAVLEHIQRVIDDPRVKIKVLERSEPMPISDIDSWGFGVIRQTILQIYPQVVVSPFLATGTVAEGRHFTGLSRSVYVGGVLWVGPDDVERFHGTDERIDVENYEQVVRFYAQLIRNSQH